MKNILSKKRERMMLSISSGTKDVRKAVDQVMVEPIDIMTVPEIVKATMIKAKDLNLPGKTKKDIVVQIIGELLDSSELNEIVIHTVKQMVPYLIDTIFTAGNAQMLFDQGKKCCKKNCF